MEGGGRESPGVRVPFFRVAERKEPKKGRPHCLRPLRFATGQPAVLGFGGVSLELAALGLACAARGACAGEMGPSEAKARVDVLSPLPLWMCRGAQGLADQGSRVSERRAAARVERDPARPEHRRLPRSEAQGTQTVGSPFLWFLSFGDAKERDSPAGRLPASALKEGKPFDARKPTDLARATDA